MTDLSLLQTLLDFFATNPTLRLTQGAIVLFASVFIFMVLFATRDILLRTRSLLYQLACILLVSLLPIFGFLLYLLIRPARTTKERETHRMIAALTEKMSEPSRMPVHSKSFTVSEVKMKKAKKKENENE